MKRNANYALVGFSAVIAFFCLIVFVVWFARLQFVREHDIYDIVFVGPVRGLSQGGEVRFNGIKVGEVTDLALDSADAASIIARVRLASDVPVRADSYAMLEPQGITGLSYVQITVGSHNLPFLKDVTPRGQVPLLRSQSSALSDMLAGGGQTLGRAVETLNQVKKLLSEENASAFSASRSDLTLITASVRERKEIVADAKAALQNIDQAADEISKTSQSAKGLINADGRKTLASINDAATEIKAAASDARATTAALRNPSATLSAEGSQQMRETIGTLKETGEALQRLIEEVKSNPAALISSAPAREADVAP